MVAHPLHTYNQTCELPPVATTCRHQYGWHYAGRCFYVPFHSGDSHTLKVGVEKVDKGWLGYMPAVRAESLSRREFATHLQAPVSIYTRAGRALPQHKRELYEILFACKKVYVRQTRRRVNVPLREYGCNVLAAPSDHLAIHVGNSQCQSIFELTRILFTLKDKKARESWGFPLFGLTCFCILACLFSCCISCPIPTIIWELYSPWLCDTKQNAREVLLHYICGNAWLQSGRYGQHQEKYFQTHHYPTPYAPTPWFNIIY